MQPDVLTFDDITVQACTIGDVGHDWRPYVGVAFGREHTYWRCVWCHGVTCGNYGEHDPCMEPMHHRGPHKSKTGLVWPLGGNRPCQTT